jgi:hypothetical protein
VVDSHDWRTLRELFDKAVSLDLAELALFLDMHCQKGSETRTSLVSLLDAHMKEPALQSPFDSIDSQPGSPSYAPGDVIGDYLYGTNAARVYVYSGSDGSLIYQLSGVAGSQYGFRVCGIGDITGDSKGEILVGAWGDDTILPNQGRAFVYSGADGSLIRTHEGTRHQGWFGHTVSLLGDLDLDGTPDYLVGAPGQWTTAYRGEACVYSGASGELLYDPIAAERTGIALAGWQQCQGFQNFNNDGIPDFAMCDIGDSGGGSSSGRHYRVDGATGLILGSTTGFSSLSGFGGTPWTPAGNIGDITGDCVSDGLIASWRSQVGASEGGQAHVIDTANGTILRVFTSSRANAYLAGTLSGAGDVNGDGLGDYILAANGADSNRGAVYVVAGKNHRVPHIADVNQDGFVTPTDFTAWIQAFNNNDPSADQNLDGQITPTDFTAWISNFNSVCCC